jgi:hypothetical protein
MCYEALQPYTKSKVTAHTCTLRRAMNLIRPKIIKASHPKMRNAYNNKYTSK